MALLNGAQSGASVAAIDWDNTCVRGDIGESTFEILAREGVLRSDTIEIVKPGVVEGPQNKSGDCIIDTYRSKLDLAKSVTDIDAAYRWAVEIMEGLSPAAIVCATKSAVEESWSSPNRVFPAPALRPELVELIVALRSQGGDVWIVRASNVWSVRWAVLHLLNPRIQAAGLEPISPENVVGVSTELVKP